VVVGVRRALVVASCAAAAFAPVAGAVISGTIVPQRGMVRVTLGMHPAKVRSILGVPPKIRRASNTFGAYSIYKYRGVAVTFQGGKVVAIETSSKRVKTASGVGVGSTEGAVRSGVPGTRCRTDGGVRHCFVGAFLPGKRVTDFFFKKGVVRRVVIGFVLD
jgi:hypothetical protein